MGDTVQAYLDFFKRLNGEFRSTLDGVEAVFVEAKRPRWMWQILR